QPGGLGAGRRAGGTYPAVAASFPVAVILFEGSIDILDPLIVSCDLPIVPIHMRLQHVSPGRKQARRRHLAKRICDRLLDEEALSEVRARAGVRERLI